jgi:hypothetical protein
MQIALNDDSEYDGGRLVFATSEGFLIPRRPAGSATIHTHEVVHGVTALRSGVRYGLFLCDTRGSGGSSYEQQKAKSMLQFLLPKAVSQFKFYEKAVDILINMSDADLYECQSRYCEQLFAHSASGSASDDLDSEESLACEVLRHLHTLHPSLYARARLVQSSATDAMKTLGVDLVIKGRNHVSFMQDLLDMNNHGSCSERALEEACVEYVKFLSSLNRADSDRNVPSLLVDHIWHTHMSFPDQYSSDCMELCGFEVDHVVV